MKIEIDYTKYAHLSFIVVGINKNVGLQEEAIVVFKEINDKRNKEMKIIFTDFNAKSKQQIRESMITVYLFDLKNDYEIKVGDII